MVRPLCRAASWWRRLGTLLLLVGIVLSPLRAMAATIPVLTAYEVAVRSTATTVLGKHDAVRPETERARTACADATFAYDDFSNWPTAAGLRGVLAYDGAVELTELRELTEGAIYDATAPTAAAEAAPSAYSVAFQTTLDASELGLSRARHFAIANEALADARAASSELAELVPAPAGRASPPSGWVWQHATIEQGGGQAGVMQLVPKAQHTAGSPFWRLLHPLPNGGGGYSEWAIPAGAPPN